MAGASALALSCGLTQFPDAIFDLADTLEHLDLSGNELSSLPFDFGRLGKLKRLFLSQNRFTEVPEVIADCPQLEMVGFKANRIATMSERAVPPNTRWLILTDNCLERLPDAIGQCPRLEKLMLAGNRLTALPASLAACVNLALLRISANRLEQLPAWLLTMPRLSWLAFAGNPCTAAPAMPADLPCIDWHELELQTQLGEGASGVISEALWLTEGRQVAVKLFKGELTSDGLPASEMAACVAAGRDPNLVAVLGKLGGHPGRREGLVLELIDPAYANLGLPPTFASCTRDVYAPGSTFSARQIADIGIGIASACATLHAKGLMHGDLYAHNIMVDATGPALLGDFGAATSYERAGPQASQLERIEVRAFGCLLEDLLAQQTNDWERAQTPVVSGSAPPFTGTHRTVAQSNCSMGPRRREDDGAHWARLRDACLDEVVERRPDFAAIVAALEAVPVGAA
ncbi:leucine-rich repeat-containing protein kinase family protein [Massilia glaciei]|uniref:leucine-rich repeat-containing protein kinase family protein n=1 Tax=Massilia glaciei TaxID=1524097 RepID=UPI003F8A29FD